MGEQGGLQPGSVGGQVYPRKLSEKPPSLLLALAIPLQAGPPLYMHTHTPTQTHTSTLLHKYCANKVSHKSMFLTSIKGTYRERWKLV